MRNKRVVRKLKPWVKIALVAIFAFIIMYSLWSNFSHFIIKKKVVSEKTQVQKNYVSDYKNAKNDEKKKAFAKMFASDFFSFRNKSRKGEIGGLSYVDQDIKEEFRNYVLSTYYQYFSEIKNEVGANSMPNVQSVKIKALRDIKYLPYTSRVNFEISSSPKNVIAADISIIYDRDTEKVSRYHSNATIYFILKKGEYKIVKLVSK